MIDPAAPRLCVPKRVRPVFAPVAARAAVHENPANHALGLAALEMPHAQHAALVTAKKWKPGKVLPIAFRGGRQSDRNAILAAGAEWSHYANVKFTFTRDDGSSVLRVAFWDASDDGGSWSYVGTDALVIPPNEPTINIGWPDDPGRDLHELGHALGLIHEHQNPLARIPWNRPAVYAYYMGPPNRWTREEVDTQVLANEDEPLTNGGYDRSSIMEYPIPAALLTDPRAAVGWNKVLSPGDKRLVGQVYPFQITPTNVRPPRTSPVTPQEQVSNVLDRIKAAVSDGHPVDFAALGVVVLEAVGKGGQAAVWPAIVAQAGKFVTDPQVLADVSAVLKAIEDPTVEHVVQAVFQEMNSPVARSVATTVISAFRGLVGHAS